MSTERAENDLITEKLLRWERKPVSWAAGWEWRTPSGDPVWHEGPNYLSWAAAGLILDALAEQGIPYLWRHEPEAHPNAPFRMEIYTAHGRHCGGGNHGPLTIRAAALQYLQALEHAQAGHA